MANEEDYNQALIEFLENETFSQFFLENETLTGDSAEQMEYLDMEIENPLLFPTCGTPSFNFDPNSFPNLLPYDQPAVTVDETTLGGLKTNENEGSVGRASGTKVRFSLKRPTNVEKNVDEVKKVLIEGCLCLAKNCFADFDAEYVYQQRMNVLTLNKTEHNMLLMGAVMTSLVNVSEPALKTYMKYNFLGTPVCKDAFLYLLCCTHQQLHEVRDHFINYGVSLMECSKKTTNYRAYCEEGLNLAKEFMLKLIEKHLGDKYVNPEKYTCMPWGISKKRAHQAYEKYIHEQSPGRKPMAYSTFRNFLMEYFSHIVFYRYGGPAGGGLVWPQIQNKVKNEKIAVVGDIGALSSFAVIPPQDNIVQCQNQDSLKVPDILKPSTSTNFL